MTSRIAPLAVAALALTASLAAAAPIDRVPTTLVADTRDHRSALANASEADDADELRAAVADADDVAPRVVPHLVDLGGDDGALLAELWATLQVEARAGNVSNARSVADAAVNTLDDGLVDRAKAWDADRTTVTPGVADGARVPLVLIHPPAQGIGAFDIRVTADGAAGPTDATVAFGHGRTRIDAANASARLASFDAKALAGLDTSSTAVVLGHVRYPADAGTLEVDVDVVELVDPDGRPVPAVSPGGAAAVAGDGGSVVPSGVLTLLAVGGLGLVAVAAVRRVVRL